MRQIKDPRLAGPRQDLTHSEKPTQAESLPELWDVESELVRCSSKLTMISGFSTCAIPRFHEFPFCLSRIPCESTGMHSGFLSYVFDAGSSEGSPPVLYTIGSRGHLQMISKQAVNWARQFHPQELFEWIFSLVVKCNFIVRLVGFGHTATVEFPGILLVSDLQVHWGKLRIPQKQVVFSPRTKCMEWR